MILRQANPDDCALIYRLAVPSWEVAYSGILTNEQLAYMLEMMYSEKSLRQQMQDGHVFFIASSGENQPVGFISVRPKKPDFYILEKLYVLPQAHGTGAGRFLVEEAEKYIRGKHPGQPVLFELNVNRANRAVDFYERMGFHIDRTVDENIGRGFYKNDYIMQKTL